MGQQNMWEMRFELTAGCALMAAAWAGAFALIAVGWWLGIVGLMAVGLACSALAAALTIMRDNQRTRRMLARSGERVAPLRVTDL